MPELFGQRDRVLGTAIGGACQNLIGGIITMVVLRMFATFGVAMTLVPFVVVNIIYSLFVWAKVPETGGKSFLVSSLIVAAFQALCAYYISVHIAIIPVSTSSPVVRRAPEVQSVRQIYKAFYNAACLRS